MAFWGVEVKPGKPFTHSFDVVRGKLHISQATLGIGSSVKKSLVQCNVGDKSPVLICALLPDKTESCHLDLEFEESDEVVFSVIGPRSVHLTGYYVGIGRSSNYNDDTESFGEDIAHSASENSAPCTDEDEYDNSFIDDGDLEVCPSSPLSSDRMTDEEMLDKKKKKDKKVGRKRPKKKYKLVESDDEESSEPENIVKGARYVPGPESEDEDSLLLSSLCKSKTAAMDVKVDAQEKANKETGGTVNQMTESDDNYVTESKGKSDDVIDGERQRGGNLKDDSLMPSDEADPKKKMQEQSKEEGTHVTDNQGHPNALTQDVEALADSISQDLPVPNWKPATDVESNLPNSLLPHSDDVGPETNTKLKKKKRGRSKEIEGDQNNHEESKPGKDEAVANNMDQNPTAEKETEMGSGDGTKRKKRRKEQVEEIPEPSSDKRIDFGSKEKKLKKKKKSERGNDENEDTNATLLSTEENKISVTEPEDNNNVASEFSRARTLSSGLIIEELQTGEPDGKIAVAGKKVKVQYVGKLKENGKVFDSNAGKAPYRFRLGDDDILEGWNIGLDGMCVGEKRRLTIPPSMGYGSEGINKKVPPNSWLVYDVELLGVR